tara:strand:+ start:367 stop:1812 length:1446 start_codon:yes stop_codon:yes gene_type:complete
LLLTIKNHSFELIASNDIVTPRFWQKELIRLVRRRLILNSKHRDLLIHAGPGAGKTLGALLAFKTMQREGLLNRFIVFCHRNSILHQWKESAKILELSLEVIEEYEELEEPVGKSDSLLITYQGAAKNENSISLLIKKWADGGLLAIADEVHHLGVSPDQDEGPAWGRAFSSLTDNFTLRLGLTGTPFRADNLAFCAARKIRIEENGSIVEQISPDLIVEPRELIAAGDVRPIEFHFQDGWVEHSKSGQPDRDCSQLSIEERESWRSRNLRRAIRLSDTNSIALNLLVRARQKLEKVRLEHQNAAGLVIARDILHAKSIASFLEENGDTVQLVHSQDKESAENLASFEEAGTNWLVSVDMCSEGFDSPRIRLVAYLTTIVTKSRFIQAITRSVRMSSLRESIESIPRNPSFVYAPADPLLMEYARFWSISKPYLIAENSSDQLSELGSCKSAAPSLPLEAVNDGAGKLIEIASIQLPQFLK